MRGKNKLMTKLGEQASRDLGSALRSFTSLSFLTCRMKVKLTACVTVGYEESFPHIHTLVRDHQMEAMLFKCQVQFV